MDRKTAVEAMKVVKGWCTEVQCSECPLLFSCGCEMDTPENWEIREED
jgi:hypothetical protein